MVEPIRGETGLRGRQKAVETIRKRKDEMKVNNIKARSGWEYAANIQAREMGTQHGNGFGYMRCGFIMRTLEMRLDYFSNGLKTLCLAKSWDIIK